MVQSVNNPNVPIEPNPVGGSRPNSSKVTENKTAQFETSVQKLQENFLNDAKLLKASRTVRSFGDIFTANMANKGFGRIAQFFTNIKLYRQEPEKLLQKMSESVDKLSAKIAEECRAGKELSKMRTDSVLKFVKQAQVQIDEFKSREQSNTRGQSNVPPENDVRSPKGKEEDACISEYGKKLERLIQPKRLFKDLSKGVQTLTQSILDRCKTSDGLSSEDIQNLSSEIQSFAKNIQNLKDAFRIGLPVTEEDPVLPKTVQGVLGGFLREDVFLLEDFSKNLIQACTLSENLNDQNFKESFGNIEKLKSEFNPKEKFGGYLFKDQGDFANPAAHALKQAAFKFIDQNIKKFIGIDDFIEKTKNELKNRYPSDENRQDFELRQACGKYRREHSDRIESLKSFITTEQEDLDLKDIRKEFEGQLNRLNEWCLTKKFDT